MKKLRMLSSLSSSSRKKVSEALGPARPRLWCPRAGYHGVWCIRAHVVDCSSLLGRTEIVVTRVMNVKNNLFLSFL
jgi:hypothetical protein